MAELQSSIIAGIQAPQVVSREEREVSAANREAAGLKRDQIAQASRDQAALRQAMARFPDDINQASTWLAQQGFGHVGTAIREEYGKAIKAEQDARKSTLDADEAQWKQLSALSTLMTDEQSYQNGRRMVLAADPQLGQFLPDAFDPETVKRFGQLLLTAKDKMDDERARLFQTQDLEQKVLDREETTRAHDLTFESARLTREAAALDRAADNERQAATAAEQARHNRVMEARPVGGGRPIAVMGPDGKSVLVMPQDAVGRQPASSREQGRPVISGDANRIADFDTSLDDLKEVRKTLKGAGSTGVLPEVGAAVPNFVTNITGFGVGAKQRQAVIDRVKQVIGKALEGGVLRKEDEAKYAKILPTIADAPAVVTTKLDGLESALKQRRQTLLDSLQDAGYDTSRYNARDGAPTERNAVQPTMRFNPATGKVEPIR